MARVVLGMKIFMIADPVLSRYGPVTPVFLLGREFSKRGHEVYMISPVFLADIKEFEGVGIRVLNLDTWTLMKGEPSVGFFEHWAREAVFSTNSKKMKRVLKDVERPDVVVNFSNTVAARADVWYVQGSVAEALRNMYSQLPAPYKVGYLALRPFIDVVDRNFIRRVYGLSRVVIANSESQRRAYEERGIRVYDVIYPPLDTGVFRPSTSDPSGDYVLVYFGKETDYTAVKAVADAGVKIVAFGSKALSVVPGELLDHPNIDIRGYVDDESLVRLYSNALFTFFPFTEEPFGYIPIESMACGTPVLTYRRQGPGETVIHGITGWLASDTKDIVRLAVRIWKEGYPSLMRRRCRERAMEFDVRRISEKWLSLLSKLTKVGD